MDPRKLAIIKISDEILSALLNFRKQNPTFTFSLRKSDSVQSKEVRLKAGQWFQGSTYLFVPLFRAGDWMRKLKTIGFAMSFGEDGSILDNYIEISFKGLSEKDDEVAFHKELAEKLNIQLNKDNVGIWHYPEKDKYLTNLTDYLNRVYPTALELIKKHGLSERYVVPEDVFQRRIEKINEIKTTLKKGAAAVQVPETIELSLNQIFYGPPGTGKTYELNRLKRLYFTDEGRTVSREEILQSEARKYSFWEVIAAALHSLRSPTSVKDLVSHPIILAWIKPEKKTNPMNLVWGNLQAYADDESTQLSPKYRRSLKLFHKNGEGKWSIANDKVGTLNEIIEQGLLDLAFPNANALTTNTITVERYNFVTFHQKYSYEDFIEGIKPVLKKDNELKIEEDKGLGTDLAFQLRKGIFYNAAVEALLLAGFTSFEECYSFTKAQRKEKFDQVSGIKSKQYALFIDEINRANISAVFGELITLLEPTKRLGDEEEMWIELPYSGEKFGVPPNLYLIGSMNTADRSIALVDIALRRRFDFVSLYPDYDEIPEWGSMLKAMNEKIYDLKKNPDFFIGHAFFINKDIDEKYDIFNLKIIPLLMEYFQNNLSHVKAVLDAAEIQVEEPSILNNYQLVANEAI